eukprot:CCRYP_014006-RA/>CCRYP_014006-RA protein AED:0.15 eAED:0.15 QI:0/-1/0/1/-1/1/1/0/671
MNSMNPSDYLQLLLLNRSSSEVTPNEVWEASLKQQQLPPQIDSSTACMSRYGYVNDSLRFPTALVGNFRGNAIHTVRDSSSFPTSGQSSLQNDQVPNVAFPRFASTAFTHHDASPHQCHAFYASLPDPHKLILTSQAKQDSHVARECNFPSTVVDFSAAFRLLRENSHCDNATCSLSTNASRRDNITHKMRGSSSFPTHDQSSHSNNIVSNAQSPPFAATVETRGDLGINRSYAGHFFSASASSSDRNCTCQANPGSDSAATCYFPANASVVTAACGQCNGIVGNKDASRNMSRCVSYCPGSIDHEMRVSSAFPTRDHSSISNNQGADAIFPPVRFTLDACCDSDVNQSHADLLAFPASSRDRITNPDLAATCNFRKTVADYMATCGMCSEIPRDDNATHNISRHSSPPCNVICGMRRSSFSPTDGHSSNLMNELVTVNFPFNGSTVDILCNSNIHQGRDDLLPFREHLPDQNMNVMCRLEQNTDVDTTRAMSSCTECIEIHSISEAPHHTSRNKTTPLSPSWEGAHNEINSSSRHCPNFFPDEAVGIKMLQEAKLRKPVNPSLCQANERSFNEVCQQDSWSQLASVKLTNEGSEQCSQKCTRMSMSPKQKRKVARKKSSRRSKHSAYPRSTSHYFITPSSATIVALQQRYKMRLHHVLVATNSGVILPLV